ncbi:MAG: PrsW family intramembrane metalloprotease [Patescibacteria group bacterium]
MDFYRLILYIIFGILPSLTWLAYYLSKDLHPESKKMILKIFLWGTFITLPVFFAQIGLSSLLNKMNFSPIVVSLIYWFLVIAFTEEIFKYLVIKIKVITHYEFDEPLDAMLYMVVVALGFAAVENILYLLPATDALSFNDILNRAMIVSFIRFIGATFLHTLSSAVAGYFLAMSFYKEKGKRFYVFFGLFIAVVLHGAYNFSIMTLEGPIKIIIPIVILITLACFVFAGFEKLKKLKGICLAPPDLAKRDKIN